MEARAASPAPGTDGPHQDPFSHQGSPAPGPSPDDRLVTAARSGNREAFAALFARYHDPLQRWLAHLSSDEDLAADTAQEAFLIALQKLPQLANDQSFANWLFRIGQNLLRAEWRAKGRHKWVSFDAIPEELLAGQLLLPIDELTACVERDGLAQALATLTPRLRETILMHDVDGLTAREIADALAISPAAAEQRISRARGSMRQAMVLEKIDT